MMLSNKHNNILDRQLITLLNEHFSYHHRDYATEARPACEIYCSYLIFAGPV